MNYNALMAAEVVKDGSFQCKNTTKSSHVIKQSRRKKSVLAVARV